MNANQTCCDEILRVSDVVHAHARALIHLHNKIEHAQNSFVSIIKNLFGSDIAFEDLAREAVALDTTWRGVVAEVAAVEHKLTTSMARRESEYLQIVQRYAQANATAAAILAERQTAFSEAAKSAKRSTHTYAQTRKLTVRYEEAVAQCQQLFEQLKHETFSFLSSNA